MKNISLLLAFFIVSALHYAASAQTIVEGTISDAETGSPLPAANIQIEGTFRGTISNDNGQYMLKLDSLPAKILVSYIGYASQGMEVTSQSGRQIDIRLQPVAYELEPIVVTGEDPAVRIMREVIRRKQQWRAALNTYQAEAYTRVVLENDTSITSIMESISTAFWDKKEGTREMIRSKRQTSNISAEENFANTSLLNNMYDDDVEIAGFKMIGVTHPDALEYYNFELTGQRQIDKRIVYDISVEPKGKLQPAFVGRISVLDSVFAMIDVDLKPGEAVMYPPPIQKWDIHYQQQFSNFGSQFWLPVDVRSQGSIRIGIPGLQFPTIKINRVSRLTDYRINIVLPDSIFQQKELSVVDSATIKQDADSVFAGNPEVVPFSGEEQAAYGKLDSTRTLAEAYRPTGALARFVKVETDEGENRKNQQQKKQSGLGKLSNGITPVLGYNRVDEASFGLKKNFNFLKNLQFYFSGGYKTGLRKWFWGTGADFRFGAKSPFSAKLVHSENTDSRYGSPNYPEVFAAIPTLLGYADYFDYYWNRKTNLGLQYRIPRLNSVLTVGLNDERHSSLVKTTDYNLAGRDILQRENPPIWDGKLRSIEFKLVIGEDYIPFGFVGQNRLEIGVEHSSPNLFSSDFDFTRYQVAADFRMNTFLQRRLLPNALDLRLVAGTASGNLPPQRFGILDGTLLGFSPFGTFHSLSGRPYEGEKYLAVFAEHNFRTVPFELLGLRAFARRNWGIILHGAAGQSWISAKTPRRLDFIPRYPQDVHSELGISLNGLFGLFRLDFTRRLDEPAYFIGISAARLF